MASICKEDGVIRSVSHQPFSGADVAELGKKALLMVILLMVIRAAHGDDWGTAGGVGARQLVHAPVTRCDLGER